MQRKKNFAVTFGGEMKGQKFLEKQKKGISKFFGEFKTFISRGNIVDLSVAVIIGGAFSAIVTALTNKIIMPLVNWILALCGGADGLESAYTILSPAYTTDAMGNQILDLNASIYINWGDFIASILNFFIIAFTLFLIVKTVNASKKQLVKMEDDAKKKTSKEYIDERLAVKKQAKEEGRKFKTVWAEYLAQKEEKAKAEEEAKKQEEERIAKEKQEAFDKLSNEEKLLTQIRDMLAEKK